MAYQTILMEKKEQITTITLNRPQSKNAMNPQMHFDMCDALAAIERDEDCRVLVITGSGDSFCAGMDVKEYFYDTEEKPESRAAARKAAFEWMFKRLRLFPKPTIAAVNGWCFGGAFAPLVSCDLAIAAEEAQFGLSEVNWGILPGGSVTRDVAESMSYRDALYYVITGKTFSAARAREIGLVNDVVPRAQLREAVMALVADIARLNPAVLRSAKEALKYARGMDYDTAYDYLRAKQSQLRMRDPEGGRARGLTQFLDQKSFRPGLQPYARPET